MRGEQLLKIATLALVACATLLLLVVLWQLAFALVLCFLALGMSAALSPLIERLQGRGWPRWLSLTVVYLGVAVFVVAIPVGLAGPIVGELSDLATQVAAVSTEPPTDSAPQEGGATAASTAAPHSVQQWLRKQLPALSATTRNLIGDGSPAALWSLLGFTWGAFEATGNLIIVFVLSMYWSADHEHFERLWFSMLSVERRSAARELWHEIEREVGAYLRSEAVQCLLAGVFLGAGYYLLGFPYPTLLALLCALAWLIPWGGIVIAVGCTLLLSAPVVLAGGDTLIYTVVLPVLLLTVLVLLVLEYLVEPRFFNRLRYNSLLVLLVVVVLTEAFGIAGLILAPPLAAAIQVTGSFLVRRQSLRNSTPEGVALDQRMEDVWHAVEQIEDAPPELVNMLDRLGSLAVEARRVRA